MADDEVNGMEWGEFNDVLWVCFRFSELVE